jgi:deoxyribodipyrimidine photo-lyase
MQPDTALLWFRRDLRVHDHPALVAAAEHERLVALFVLDPALIGGRFASPNRTWFLLGSVAALRDALRERGSELTVRVGDPEVEVPAVAAAVGARHVYLSRDHAPYGRARDAAVASALEGDGIGWHPKRGVLVHEPDEVLTGEGGGFTVYSPFRRAWEALPQRAVLAAPDRLPPPPVAAEGRPLDPGPIPSLAELGLGDAPTGDPALLPEPGESAARARLERWVAGPIEHYAASRDRLDADGGTSRLSQDLHLGTISPLEVMARSEGPGPDRRTYRNELVWREFYAHVLFHRPEVRLEPFRTEFADLPWRDDPEGLAAWSEGRTGYPVVDAGLRQLRAMGWMHNRARMVAASFLTKHLLIRSAAGEAVFMHHLVDGDVASNGGGWQWSASTGTDPQPYFRIFNPILQGRRHDPDGAYVRRWIPELARVPTERIHAPWEMRAEEQAAAGCRVGVDYPAPIVEHGEARARALAVFEAARDAAGRARAS